MNIDELAKICKRYPCVKVKKSSDRLKLDVKNNFGSGTMKFIFVCSGLLMSYIDIHAPVWEESPWETEDALMRLNYCVNGRCEIELENGEFTYLSGGDLSLSKVSAKREYKYPGGRYEGIEIFAYGKILENGALRLFGKDIVNINELFSDCCRDGVIYAAGAAKGVEAVFHQLWQLKDRENTDLIRLKVLEAFLQMKDTPLDAYIPPRTYYTSFQVEIAKKAEAMISADLSIHYTAGQLAHIFGVSESSFKNYFKGVFGKSFSLYQKCRRMELAAELLENTGYKLSEIAGRIGYENHSKFSSAFKAYYKVSPSDYRRKRRLEKIK